MRWFFAALAVIAGTLIGYFFALRKKKRVKILSDFNRLCDTIDQNMGYTHDKIRTVLDKARSDIGKETGVFIEKFETLLGSPTLERELKKSCSECKLKPDESATVISMLTSYGKSDAVSQREMLYQRKKELDGYLTRAQEDYKKNAKLYLELGVLLGIGVGILLI